LQAKDEQTLSFLNRLDKLRLSERWTWEQAAKSIGLSRTMLHYLRSGRSSVTDKTLYRLAEAEKAAGVETPRGDKAKVLVEAMHSNLREVKKEVTASDHDRGYVLVKLQFLRGEPPKGLPAEIKVLRPQHAVRSRLLADVMRGDYESVLSTCLPKENANKEFLEKLTPFTLEALEEAAMSLVFGTQWKQHLPPKQ
jgi:transcriptional regulator with XRE-family HTH domain